MVGAPKHVISSLKVGTDIIIAQGGEAGGHTGDISAMVLTPQCADLCKGKAVLVGAGGIYDGRGIAASMALGASGVWVGTRFVMTHEANANVGWLKANLAANSGDTIRTEIYTGRPLRGLKNPHNMGWAKREAEARELYAKGKIPTQQDVEAGIIPID